MSGTHWGITLKIISVVLLTLMLASLKAAGNMPVTEVIFFRASVGMLPVLVVLQWRGELRGAFRTSRPGGQIMRGFLSSCAIFLLVYSLQALPLPEAITLQYAQPLLVVIMSAIFLGERVRFFRWTAVAIGFAGVVVITYPNLHLFAGDNGGVTLRQTLGVGAAILSATFSAIVMLVIRTFVSTEKSSTIVLWFCMLLSLIMLPAAPFGWIWPAPEQWLFLILGGVTGGLGQLLLTESMRHAQVSTIAPFEYSSILFASLFSYVLFSELPHINTVIGSVIITAAGLLIIWREKKVGVASASRAGPTSG